MKYFLFILFSIVALFRGQAQDTAKHMVKRNTQLTAKHMVKGSAHDSAKHVVKRNMQDTARRVINRNRQEKKIEISSKMSQLRTALMNRDSIALDSLLAADVTYGHSNGMTQSRSELIRSVMSREQDYKKMDVRKMDIRFFGNTAVVNLEADVSLIMTGKPMDLDMDALLVWVKRKGCWQLVARQSVKNS
jgi:hypothetical protein